MNRIKHGIFGLLCLMMVLLFTGCGSAEQSIDDKVDGIIRTMTPAEKLGQMVMIGIHGGEINADSQFMLQQYHIGGIILFDRNFASESQIKKLTSDLTSIAKKRGKHQLPLLIAVDDEGGEVVRLAEAVPPPPAQLEIGGSGKPQLAREWAEKTGRKLKEIGVSVNFAPVADIGSFGSRHYSEDFTVVTDFVREAVSGYESAGIICALKHFPGIGKCGDDTHFSKGVVDVPVAELLAEDVVPFQKLIAEKKPENMMIMVSHVIYPELSGKEPASLSKAVMTGLLREKLGFKGVVITDDMEMDAVSAGNDFKDLGVRAVKAGADIVLVCHEYGNETAVYLGLLEAWEKGELSEAQVNESVRRILKMKLSHN